MEKNITDYCESYGFFHKLFVKQTGVEDNDLIFGHWIHLTDTICDCEGCREDADCAILIECDDFDDDVPDGWE